MNGAQVNKKEKLVLQNEVKFGSNKHEEIDFAFLVPIASILERIIQIKLILTFIKIKIQ